MEAESKTSSASPDERAFRSALRREVVTAMARALAAKNFPETPWETMSPGLRKGFLENQLIAFDAQHDLVRVNHITATEAMAIAGVNYLSRSQGGLAAAFDVMSAAGDLTGAVDEGHQARCQGEISCRLDTPAQDQEC